MKKESAYDIAINSLKGKRFAYADYKKKKEVYEITGIFFDDREQDRRKAWHMACKNITKGIEEKLEIADIRELVEED